MRAALLVLFLIAQSASLVSARAADAPFEPAMLRLAEILGSLHFLQTLCGGSEPNWRQEMEMLLAAENPEAERKARFIASFNEGFRAFARNYSTCTPSATAAIALYREEGESLARDVMGRYGN
jgi:uncharacterized protein (TIGR02301 family)